MNTTTFAGPVVALLMLLVSPILILGLSKSISSRLTSSSRRLMYSAGFVLLVATALSVWRGMFNFDVPLFWMMWKVVLLVTPLYLLLGCWLGGERAGWRKRNADRLEGWKQQLDADRAAAKDPRVIVTDLKAVGKCYLLHSQKQDAAALFDEAFMALKAIGEHAHAGEYSFLLAYHNVLCSVGRKDDAIRVKAVIASIPERLRYPAP